MKMIFNELIKQKAIVVQKTTPAAVRHARLQGLFVAENLETLRPAITTVMARCCPDITRCCDTGCCFMIESFNPKEDAGWCTGKNVIEKSYDSRMIVFYSAPR